MSFLVVSRKKRVIYGVGTVLFIALIFAVLFYISEPQTRQYPPIVTDIYKDKELVIIPFYEASADQSCVSILNEGKTPEPKTPSKNPLDAPLVQASAPKCKGVGVVPTDHTQLGKDGFVTLALNVTKEGKIERGEVEKTSGFPALDEAALKHVTEQWEFTPCQKLNKAVACKQKIKFRWKE